MSLIEKGIAAIALVAAFTVPVNAAVFDLAAGSGYAQLQAAGVGMDFATIGAPGNSANPESSRGWGSVNYTYGMGKTEVTWGQYAVFLNSTGYSSYMFDSTQAPYIGLYRNGDGTVGVRAGCQDKAMSVVRYSEAVAFANWLGTGDVSTTGMFHLPTVDEWYKAAYYDANRYGQGQEGYWTYGTGSDALTDADAFYGYLSIAPNSSQWPDATYGTANQYGLYGMTGGVEEWTSTAQNTAGTRYWALGGAWNLTEDSLTNARLNNLAQTSANDKLGFRIVADLAAVPEPSTYALLVAAVCVPIAVWRRRKR